MMGDYRDDQGRVVRFRCSYRGRAYYDIGRPGATRELVTFGSPAAPGGAILEGQWADQIPTAEELEVWAGFCAHDRVAWIRHCEKYGLDVAEADAKYLGPDMIAERRACYARGLVASTG